MHGGPEETEQPLFPTVRYLSCAGVLGDVGTGHRVYQCRGVDVARIEPSALPVSIAAASLDPLVNENLPKHRVLNSGSSSVSIADRAAESDAILDRFDRGIDQPPKPIGRVCLGIQRFRRSYDVEAGFPVLPQIIGASYGVGWPFSRS